MNIFCRGNITAGHTSNKISLTRAKQLFLWPFRATFNSSGFPSNSDSVYELRLCDGQRRSIWLTLPTVSAAKIAPWKLCFARYNVVFAVRCNFSSFGPSHCRSSVTPSIGILLQICRTTDRKEPGRISGQVRTWNKDITRSSGIIYRILQNQWPWMTLNGRNALLRKKKSFYVFMH